MIAPDSQRVMSVFGSCWHTSVFKKASGSCGTGSFFGSAYNGWYTSVGVDVLERLLVKDGEVHEFSVVWELKLLEDDGDLPWVWSTDWRESVVVTQLCVVILPWL